jgi:NADPH-dependent curcumin reductase CurA
MPDRSTVHEVVLRQFRRGAAVPPSTCLAVRETERQDLAPGQVRVSNSHLLLAAVFADLMLENPPLPMPGFRVGEAISGPCVGIVVESASEVIDVGTLVQHSLGWRDESVVPAAQVFPLPDGLPAPEFALNQGVTAYHGIVDVADVGDGDVVFVSGAAGGVGSLAVQIARLQGAAKVIATAGSAQKCAYLVDDLGVEVAIDYKREDVATRLREEAPSGIDVFFDLVGGSQFEAAVPAAARIRPLRTVRRVGRTGRGRGWSSAAARPRSDPARDQNSPVPDDAHPGPDHRVEHRLRTVDGRRKDHRA